MKIIWMSDLHILPEGQALLGHDCANRLRAAVEYINQHHLDADFCVLSGDLTDLGDPESYQLLCDIMSTCPLPMLPIPGNHDNRVVMREQLPLPDNIDEQFIQYSVIKHDQRLIFLDSLHENDAEGLLCEQRLQWLDAELERHTDIPTVVFCHHPPGKLFLPMQDQDQTEYGDRLLHRLIESPNVRHLMFGHVHRPVSGCFKGLSYTALPSVSIQAPLPYPAWDWDTVKPAEEAPAIGIIHLSSDNVVVHSYNFCKALEHKVAI